MRREAAALCALALIVCAPAAVNAAPEKHWVASWASAQMVADGDNALPAAELTDATLRQTVHLSLGGAALRVRISNAFGAQPMKITSAHVAQAAATDSSAIVAGSDHALTFAGEVEVIVPAGGEVWSDPVELKTAALDDLSVSLHLAAPPARETGHPGSHANSWLAHGDQVSAASLPGARRIEHWWFLSGVDVAATAGASTVVAFGDSITDGHGSTADRNDRWPDDLARRLQAAPAGHDIGVVNTGIGGNRVLQDGLGPSALARFDRDVLSQSGVRSVIMLEGVNDIGVLTRDAPVTPQAHDAMVHHITDAYAQMIAAAHARGVRVLGGTILPYIGSGYYHPGAASEADRQAISMGWWIST
jgi:lysophospholipase L1-like esterase